MKKVLIIDDDEDIRDTVSAILAGKYEINKAENKKEGYKLLEEFIPDLIILDVMMEALTSGFDMCRELKKNKKYKTIKILMLTNVDNEFKMDFKFDAGDPQWMPVDDYIIKPLDSKELIEKIEHLIG